MRLLISFYLLFIPLIIQAQGGGGKDCPDDLNAPNNNNNLETIYAYNENGDLVDSIQCNVAGGSGNINCDLSPFPDTYFFVYKFDDGNNEIDCFYNGDGNLIDPIPLTVNIINFTIFHTKDYNTLEWSTLDETDNDFFTLEYSMNGTDWFHLTDLTGSGTTNTMSEYEYEHRISGYNIIYYKLSQTDFDGTSNKLSVKAVQSSLKDAIGLSFNKETLFISSEESISTVQIVDLSGRLVYNQQFLNSNNESINLDFNTGLYIAIVIDNSGNQRSQKFVIR